MAQPNTDDLKQRQTQSNTTYISVTRVNGVPTITQEITKSVDDKMIYTDDGWKQQETETINNL